MSEKAVDKDSKRRRKRGRKGRQKKALKKRILTEFGFVLLLINFFGLLLFLLELLK
jgi:hypothetical protein